jgi:hypothetical protein
MRPQKSVAGGDKSRSAATIDPMLQQIKKKGETSSPFLYPAFLKPE